MFLKRNPFVRLLLLLIVGILGQWHCQLSFDLIVLLLALNIGAYISLSFFKGFKKFKYEWVRGVTLFGGIASTAMLLTFLKDGRNKPDWFAKANKSNQTLAAVLAEPLIEKSKSYKVEAAVKYCFYNNTQSQCSGNIIIYFKRDSVNKNLKAGDCILLSKKPQEIHNAGNPGEFDYKRYCLFNGVAHQVYLTDKDYLKLSRSNLSGWKSAILKMRVFILNAIKQHVQGKKEQGLAEAMLIGYKDDLDKNLFQSYTNTGVVHVIAVSGMHLALLYWILNLLFKPLLKRKSTKWLHLVLVLSSLWLFSFLTGAAASIVRAAVMFSFITFGKHLNRNVSTYNMLAAAAFFQLCYNPYWLWDVGFQLSYVAVLSILIFFKPVYNLLFIKSKILNEVWKLAAVSIAAQILTTPFSMYYFHQFPVYFLLSNLVVVPVSTAVLIGSLLLVIFSPIKIIAGFVGYLLSGLIWWLNTFVERMEELPFALWKGIQINVAQVALLLIMIAGLSFWLIKNYKLGLRIGIASLILFFAIREYSFYETEQQEKIIVYNIPKHSAVDFIKGRKYVTVGDGDAFSDDAINNYVFKPSHTLQRLLSVSTLPGVYKKKNAVIFNGFKIVFVNASPPQTNNGDKIDADIVILAGNPRLYISNLIKSISPKQVVIDASVPAWKAKYWVKDCDSLKISCHNVATDGAFVKSLH